MVQVPRVSSEIFTTPRLEGWKRVRGNQNLEREFYGLACLRDAGPPVEGPSQREAISGEGAREEIL